MTDKQRIESVENFLKLSTNALAKSIELKNSQTLYDIKKGKHGISKDVAARISAKYLDIDLSWLLTGEGEMLKIPTHQNNVNGDNINGENVTVNKTETDKFLSLLAKKDEQIDRLLSLLEKK